MVFALADTAFAYVCNGANQKTSRRRRRSSSSAAQEGDTLIAEAKEVLAKAGAGVTHVAVRTAEGRPIAEFTGYSRTLGGAVVAI